MKKLLCIILFAFAFCLPAFGQFNDSEKMFGQMLNLGHWSTDGLVFLWRGIEAGNAVDESFGGNHGTITGATWAGDGLDFAAASDNDVTISNFRFPDDNGDLTLIFDITPRTTGENSSAYWMLPTDFAFYLHWNNEGLTWNRNYTGDNGRWRTANDLGLIGSRNTVVLTHSGTDLPRVYINGVFVIALPEILAPTGTADTINNKDMLIGTNTTRTRDWDGVMHGISVYNHVLSVTEIMQLSINPDLPMEQPPIWLLFSPAPDIGSLQWILDGGIGPSPLKGSVVR